MMYYSLSGHPKKVSFREAVIYSLAPDKGLYFPEKIAQLDKNTLDDFRELDKVELCYRAIQQFVGVEIPGEKLKQIVSETLCFETPLVKLKNGYQSLELFHGPTLAFKDVGARFMARCLRYFLEKEERKTTILVATSGDTGGAVANGFFDVEGIEVVILYPKGKVSPLQEKQLTTLGKNIHALEVEGSFDDCQDLVKNAFVDVDLSKKFGLTSANSINVARWLPQMFYYINALQQLKEDKENVFSVPSGNFGNICAGIVASKLGFPIHNFVAATNQNDVVPRYMSSGEYKPKETIPTISNAMDVRNPSNFIRIQQIFNQNIEELKTKFSSYSFSDEQTKALMKEVYKQENYMLDPHGAVGYLGLNAFLQNNKSTSIDKIFLETAHPIKFSEVVEETLDITIPIPDSLQDLMKKEKNSIPCANDYNSFTSILNDIF